MYFSESEKSLKLLRQGGAELGHLDSLYQASMKEVYGKQVGKLDVAINSVRTALIEGASTGSSGDRVLAERALALFPSEQEVANIKAKKLTNATNLAGIFHQSIRQGIASGGSETALFDSFMKDVLFKDSTLVNGNAQVDMSRTNLGHLPENVRKQVTAGLSGANDGSLDDVLKYVKGVFNRVGTEGYDKLGTAARNSTLPLKTDTYRHAIQRGMSVDGALSYENTRGFQGAREKLIGAIDEVTMDTKSALSSANMKMLGPLAIGIAGSMMVGAAIGDKGYSSTPMIMPGEISDHRVNSAIAAGRLGQDHNPIPPESIEPGPHMNMVNRPINTQQAYFNRKNAYSVSGQIMSESGIRDLNGMLGSLGGQSSVRINDTRMPITPNYIDRVTGD